MSLAIDMVNPTELEEAATPSPLQLIAAVAEFFGVSQEAARDWLVEREHGISCARID